MQSISQPRITPWVLRLIIANAVVLLLLETVFTSPRLLEFLAFEPSQAIRRPWTFVTYMFVHGDLFHLAFNALGLWMLGSAVEHRMGSRRFLGFYFYCGVGAAVFSVLVSSFAQVAPFVGASGAVLGIIVAFAMLWPEAELTIFPIPIPIRARTFAIGIVALNAFFALPPFRGTSMIAYEAHLGGALFGYLFFRLQALSAAQPASPMRSTVHRVVPVPPRAPEQPEREPRQATATQPATRRRRNEPADAVTSEIDRVLDKISAQGIDSLTPAERRFLDEVSQKKRQELN